MLQVTECTFIRKHRYTYTSINQVAAPGWVFFCLHDRCEGWCCEWESEAKKNMKAFLWSIAPHIAKRTYILCKQLLLLFWWMVRHWMLQHYQAFFKAGIYKCTGIGSQWHHNFPIDHIVTFRLTPLPIWSLISDRFYFLGNVTGRSNSQWSFCDEQIF